MDDVNDNNLFFPDMNSNAAEHNQQLFSGRGPFAPIDANEGASTYTSEWLKKNTKIHGWLSFFLFSITLGGVITVLYACFTFQSDVAEFSLLFTLADLIFAVALCAIAVYTVYSFSYRKPFSLFYARYYILAVAATNLLVILIGEYDEQVIKSHGYLIRSIVWTIIWIFYLQFSKQVAEIIPKSFRRVRKKDWTVITIVTMIPIVFFVVGFVNAMSSNNIPTISQESLKDWEKTDRKIVFCVPQSFKVESKNVEVQPGQFEQIFNVSNESVGDCTIVSDFDNNSSWRNFDSYFNNWKDPELSSIPNQKIDGGEKMINGNKCLYRIIEYRLDDNVVYWHYYMLFNEKTGKVAVLSAYDLGVDNSYIQKLLQSVRFE